MEDQEAKLVPKVIQVQLDLLDLGVQLDNRDNRVKRDHRVSKV
jgi:hypothetical protein